MKEENKRKPKFFPAGKRKYESQLFVSWVLIIMFNTEKFYRMIEKVLGLTVKGEKCFYISPHHSPLENMCALLHKCPYYDLIL